MDRALDSPGAAGLRRRLDRRWAWRTASVLAALGSYYLSEWLSLRVAWQAALVAGLELIGDEAQAIWTPSGPGLWLAGERFAITRNCTYLDMLLVLSPLHWRFGAALRANLLRLAVLALGLAAFNQLRIMIAIHLHAVEGVSWRAAHFWPDVLLHVAWITVAALFAMRADTWDSRREVEDDHQGPEVGQQSGLRLSKEVLADAEIAVGDTVDVVVREGTIVVTSLRRVRGRYDLRELVARIPEDDQPEELDWGPSAGREAW